MLYTLFLHNHTNVSIVMSENNHSLSVAFVCTGNTCRSPIAEMLLKHATKNEDPPLCDISILSAGVFAIDGHSASINALKALKSVDIDLSAHKSQGLTQEMVDSIDFIFCMTKAHKQIIENDFNVEHTCIQLMGKYLKTAHDIDIPDPYCQDLSTYKVCRDKIVEAIPCILSFLKKELRMPTKS